MELLIHNTLQSRFTRKLMPFLIHATFLYMFFVVKLIRSQRQPVFLAHRVELDISVHLLTVLLHDLPFNHVFIIHFT